ncbi:MAG: SPFH domain-containing protein [Chloroflexota bacterium]
MARNKRQKETILIPPVLLTVLAVLLLILIVVSLWMSQTGQNVPSSFGAFIWLGIFSIFFLLGILHYAQYILPYRTQDSWGEGIALLAKPYRDGFDKMFEPRRLRLRRGGRRDPSLQELPESFQEIGGGLLRSHQTLALSRGSAYVRDAGTGFVRVAKGERITHLIDLRTQSRTEVVKANTRDGIPVETAVTVTFRVRREFEDDGTDSLLYPYDRDAIFYVSQLNSRDSENGIRPWTEQISPQAATMLVSELAQYSLNQLYQMDSAGHQPLDDIKDRILRQLSRIFDEYRIDILKVGVRGLTLPPKIEEQRIEMWQADWERKIQMAQAAGNAEAVRRIRRARARAQIEIIENILQNVEAAKRTENANLTKIVTLRAMEVLNQAIDNDKAQTILPETVIKQLVDDATKQIQTMLERPEEPS